MSDLCTKKMLEKNSCRNPDLNRGPLEDLEFNMSNALIQLSYFGRRSCYFLSEKNALLLGSTMYGEIRKSV